MAVAALALTACGDDGDASAARDQPADGVSEPGLAGEPVEQFMHLHGLGIAPWGPDEVWVSTHQGLLLVDAAGEWTYASDDAHDFMGFNVNPTDEDVVYTSGHPAAQSGLDNPLGFMVSADRGRTWEQRSLYQEVDFHALAVQAKDGAVIYGFDATGSRLLSSDDGGHEWTERSLPDPQGVASLAVHPDDPATVLATTPTGLMRSSDSGETWEQVLAEPVTGVAYDPTDPDRIVTFQAPGGDGLVESTDGGATWESLGLEVEGEDAVFHIAMHPTDDTIIYVGTVEASVYRTLDGGQEWEQIASRGSPEGEDA